LRFVRPREKLDAFVQLELLASAPYVDFVYGDLEVPRRLHRQLVGEDIGEFAAPFGWLALDDDDAPVGILAGPLVPKELAQARWRTAMWLHREPVFSTHTAFRERATAARSALLTPVDGDAYLSRIAVAPAARRRGIGVRLLARFLDDSRSRGARRAVLEVAPAHVEAIAMYERTGFIIVATAQARHDDGRLLHYHHMAISL
jgi:ribosomal protein S18 acetylase RimI-like enzyme